ncbi:SPFH domain-containing protein [Actinopolymorpha pittospori]|uniref:Regulator of protease activity HflC (Stomatin/prohibitin superfamily) n=1 Tax=Actinopolymorpha pittospori TaxID=648752 RepID=A0A927MTU9_9ACTN|nr:SPFH domain-containing protein [Actinopolymorpha pittospori]MBE1603177.1 regulator of protease activity HflC (stomatin/prohibitin superfamily) [Actinopolymorpha pittospori]
MDYLSMAIVVVALVAILLARSVVIVPMPHAGLVERLGRYHRTLPPGLSLVVPFIDTLRYKVDLSEQTHSFTPRYVVSRDDEIVTTEMLVRFQVVDPVAATYEVANYVTVFDELTQRPLEDIVAEMDLERALVSDRQITAKLNRVLRDAAASWGVRVNEVEITSIRHSPSTRQRST